MGAQLSQIFYQQARSLGNPQEPIYFYPEDRTRRKTVHHGLTYVMDRIGPHTYDVHYGCCVLGYQIDYSKFDSGHIFVIKFKRNDWEPNCLENHILNVPGGMLDAAVFHEEGLPDILRYHLSSYITMVDFRTEKGIKIFEPVGSLSIDDLPFNTIPDALDSIPRVAISDLFAPRDFATPYQTMMVVSYKGNMYMFLNHAIFPLDEDSITWDDEILREVIQLSKFQSPFILSPSYIVTGTGKSSSKFRGFLQPFCPAGSLCDVFRRVNEMKKQVLTEKETKTSQNPIWSSWASYLTTPSPVSPNSLTIGWPVKLQWAIDVASGLVTLHKAEAYVGMLDLQHLVLARDGHIKLIDISPVMGFQLFSAAPEVDDGLNVQLTGPRDVFSLGLILWEIAEEFYYCDRDTTWQIPKTRWSDEQNGAPKWFRTLVQNCLSAEPSLRPSAAVVLSTLVSHAKTGK
ncbi:hypothetical protein BDN70DRAFT_995773 [Pholiota conissans]|uniref:Protein kinase domain-containing protein n=1 Tax=Pholiota conissans TaxID=109636 RepID=A0A9P6CQV0_9AGAR|nr:hypothetical protein BDN70DRAFT_995773 [Pholiota conissans]